MPFQTSGNTVLLCFYPSSMLMGSSAVPALWTPWELRHCLPLPSVWSGRRLLSWNCCDVAPFPLRLCGWLPTETDRSLSQSWLCHMKQNRRKEALIKKDEEKKGRKQLGSELLSRIGFPIRTCLSGFKLTKHFSRRVQALEAAEEPRQDMGVRDSLKIQNSKLQSDAVTKVAVRRSRVTQQYRKERSVWFYTSLKDAAALRHQETRPSWSELAGLEKVFEGEAAVTIWGGRRKDRDSFKTSPFLRLHCLHLYFFPSVVSRVSLHLLSRIACCALRYYSLQAAFICWKAKMLFLRRLNNTGPGGPVFFPLPVWFCTRKVSRRVTSYPGNLSSF